MLTIGLHGDPNRATNFARNVPAHKVLWPFKLRLFRSAIVFFVKTYRSFFLKNLHPRVSYLGQLHAGA